jgi:hypothetical protein
MKISGPKGPGPAPPTEPSGDKEPGKAGGPTFKEVLADRASAAQGTGPSPAEDVAARLRAGEITGAEALELLVDAVVRQRVGEAVPAIKERMRAALRRFLAEDPSLAEKIRQLGGGDDD